MLTFEKVLEIFADYLTADETIEVYISRHGCVRVEFDQDFHYCSGEVCHTPKELFNLLADDYRTYVEIELTKGRRELTEDDEREADALCKRYLERWRRNWNEDFEMLADDCNCTGRFGVDAFCLTLHGADLHIWSGAWSAQHGNCSTWRGCAYYLFPAEWCNFADYGILISPMGLPLAAIWLLGKVQDLKYAIQDRVYG